MPKYKFGDLVYNITEKATPVAGDEELYIGLEHLDSGSLRVTRWGSKVALKGDKLKMREGDILFGRRNTYLRRVAIAPHDGLFSAHGMIFRAKTERIDPDYLPFFLASDCFMEEAIRISVGSLSPTVNWKELKELEFTIPDLETQHKNAQTLLAANDLKEKYEELLAVTDDLVKSQFIELFGDPVTNSQNLKAEPLSKHLSVTGGFAFRSTDFNTEKGIPVLRIGNINSGEFLPVNMVYWPYDESLSRYFCKPGDLVISLTGTVGKDDYANICCLGNEYELYYLNQRNAKLTLKETVLPEYITVLLANNSVKAILTNAGQGVRQANISNSDILNLVVPIPDIDRQNTFAKIVKQTDKSKYCKQNHVFSMTRGGERCA